MVGKKSLATGTRILFKECAVCIWNYFLLTSGAQGETKGPGVFEDYVWVIAEGRTVGMNPRKEIRKREGPEKGEAMKDQKRNLWEP